MDNRPIQVLPMVIADTGDAVTPWKYNLSIEGLWRKSALEDNEARQFVWMNEI